MASHSLSRAGLLSKVCPSCPERGFQLLEAFYRNTKRADGHGWECKVCTNKRTCAWRTKNKKPRTIPAHGNKARYRKGCRCEYCVKAESRYRRQLYLFTDRKPYVHSGFAKRHLMHLAESPYQAAQIVGISQGTAMRIWRGDRIRVTTERKVLAI